MPYEFDESRWPLCIDFMTGEGSDDEVARYNARRAARLARGMHVQIVDARGGEHMSAAHRKLIGDFNRAHREQQGKWLAGVALVSDSMLARGYLTAVYWLSPPPYPHEVFSDMDAAKAWAEERLRELSGRPMALG